MRHKPSTRPPFFVRNARKVKECNGKTDTATALLEAKLLQPHTQSFQEKQINNNNLTLANIASLAASMALMQFEIKLLQALVLVVCCDSHVLSRAAVTAESNNPKYQFRYLLTRTFLHEPLQHWTEACLVSYYHEDNFFTGSHAVACTYTMNYQLSIEFKHVSCTCYSD